MSIVRLIGTNGAGKSTFMRKIMDLLMDKTYVMRPGRRKPMAYEMRDPFGMRVAILGHYEIANGGVDTIGDLDTVYEYARYYDDQGFGVFYEGMDMHDGAKKTIQLYEEGRDVFVIWINTPVEECVRSVIERGHKINAERIHKTAQKCQRTFELLMAAGVPCMAAPRDKLEVTVTMRKQ